jgi:hypothetical protein
MICEKIKPKLRDYCEDSVPEIQRNEIRSHLKECRECRDYSFIFSSFGSDLRRFALVEPPSQLKEKIVSTLEALPAVSSMTPMDVKSYWLWIIGLVMVLTAGGFWYSARMQRPAARSVAKAPPIAETEPALPETNSPAEEEPVNPLNSTRFDISLKPLHWDVEFSSGEKRSEFILELKKRQDSVTTHFESPSLVVFSLKRPALVEILKFLSQLGAGVNGSGTIPSYIPDFPGDVRVSLDLETAQSRITRTLNHHWHLKFQFPNKFTVKEKLRDAGGRMLYEVPEIWVMEFSGKDYEKIHDIIRGTYGLSTNVGPEQFLSTRSRQSVPIRIVFYLEEG